ncbi:GNAT family N-acetyltransferase [Christiangramia salexigens]|uniref:GNAT family N-acetyltransferase n=1 Tax=Christiangramia salexigens TaxID=1913577 RepID=A0A1L3J5W0_9FLAO|nr:GNAT family N-acetyltransferase [Christiangramia salexigens]APG60515.1 GNAT family N-acetyltransferase [Christiangramia salexigens]
MNFRLAQTDEDLQKILKLQFANLKQNLDEKEIISQGFLTCQHNFGQLKNMNDAEAHLLIEENAELAGYILALTRASEALLPMLNPMFKRFSELTYGGKPLNDYTYLIVGQVCISRNFRGNRLLDRAYDAYRNYFHKKYEFCITEVAVENSRSLKAHQRIGFKVIDNYTESSGKEWAVILWDWKA